MICNEKYIAINLKQIFQLEFVYDNINLNYKNKSQNEVFEQCKLFWRLNEKTTWYSMNKLSIVIISQSQMLK